MEAALEFQGVGKRWGGFALRGVSFRLPPGHITGLVGPNGAGKTTLVRLVLDLARPDEGKIRILGEDHRKAGAALRSRVGFVLDRPTCYDHLPVESVRGLVASFYPSWDEAAFRRLLRAFELPPRRRVSALSRGMRMKLALALALSHRAELLVLDEPTTGLDPVFRRELLERLSELVRDGHTSVLFSTPLPSDLDRVGDFVLFLRRGEVLYEGTRDEIVDRWAVVRGGPELAPELEASATRGLRETPMGLEALTDDIDAARRRFGDRAVVERATLDDLFLLLGADRGRGRSS